MLANATKVPTFRKWKEAADHIVPVCSVAF